MKEQDLFLKATIDGKETEIKVKPSDFDAFYNQYIEYRNSNERSKADKLVRDAAEIAIAYGKISTNLLQRKLRIGFGRACSIIDELEDMGVIGPATGTNEPRSILINSMEEFEK